MLDLVPAVKNMKYTVTWTNIPEDHLLHVKGVLYDTCCGHPDSQDILLGWQVNRISNTVQVIQIADSRRGKRKSRTQYYITNWKLFSFFFSFLAFNGNAVELQLIVWLCLKRLFTLTIWPSPRAGIPSSDCNIPESPGRSTGFSWRPRVASSMLWPFPHRPR